MQEKDRVDGWMDGWMEGRREGRREGRKEGRKEGWSGWSGCYSATSAGHLEAGGCPIEVKTKLWPINLAKFCFRRP